MKGGGQAVQALVRAVIVLALMAGAGFVAVKLQRDRTSQADPGAPEAAPAKTSKPAATAGLTFENTTLEAKVAADATRVVMDFRFANKSDRPITISRVEKNCTCVEMQISDGKLGYAPGERGVVRATYELGNLSGTVEKPFGLWLEGDPDDRPTHVLTPRIVIPELVELSEKTLKWSCGGEPVPRKIDLRVLQDQPLILRNVTVSSEAFKVELKPAIEGRCYELWVTPVDTANPGLALIRIETDSTVPRWKTLQAFALVRPANADPP